MSKKSKKELTCYDKAEICNSTASQMRTLMFAPVIKYKQNPLFKEFIKNNMILKFKNGDDSLQVRNRFLTQLHRDILDLILLRAEKKQIKEGYIIVSEFSEYEILKALGHKYKRNIKWFREKLQELQDIAIVLENSDKRISFHILRGYRTNKLTGQHAVIFDNSYINYFYSRDIGVNYKHLINDIVELDSPILKALVRFVISNSFEKFRMSLTNALEHIGINKENTYNRQYRKFIKTVKDSKAILKEKFNIILTDNDIIEYEYKKDISFYSIDKEQAESVLSILIENTKKDEEEYRKLQLKWINLELEGLIKEFNNNPIKWLNLEFKGLKLKKLIKEFNNNPTENFKDEATMKAKLRTLVNMASNISLQNINSILTKINNK